MKLVRIIVEIEKEFYFFNWPSCQNLAGSRQILKVCNEMFRSIIFLILLIAFIFRCTTLFLENFSLNILNIFNGIDSYSKYIRSINRYFINEFL